MSKILKAAPMIMMLIVLVLSGFTPSTHAGRPIALKAVTFVPLHIIENKALSMFADILKKKSNGALTIKIIGGPEAIPAFDQFEATRKGVVDIMQAPESYYAAAVTNVPYTHLSKFTPQEERKIGYVKLRRDLLEKHNVYYLGKGMMGVSFHFWVKNSIDKPQGMAGKKIRVSPFYVPFMKALGASPVILPPTEIYPALERGVVDGYGWAATGIVDHRWHEVCKYVIGHGVWQACLEILMNLDTYKKLPKNLQKVLDDSIIEVEKEAAAFWAKTVESDWKKLLDAGVTRIEFSPQDAKFYVDLAYSSSWADVMKNIKPQDLGPKLQKMLAK